jgi:hypothetical protein
MKKGKITLNYLLRAFLIINGFLINSNFMFAISVEPLKIGYTVSFKSISNEKMQYAKK